MQRALIQEWPATGPGTKGICLTTLSVSSCSSTRYTAYANVDGTAFQLHMSVHLAVIWAVLLITMPRFVGILCVIVHVALRMLAFRYNLVKKNHPPFPKRHSKFQSVTICICKEDRVLCRLTFHLKKPISYLSMQHLFFNAGQLRAKM